jgi:prepilin-type processing-associated H-X9-DG protein
MNISYFIRHLNKTNTAFFDLSIHESKDIIKVDVYRKPMSREAVCPPRLVPTAPVKVYRLSKKPNRNFGPQLAQQYRHTNSTCGFTVPRGFTLPPPHK